MSLTKQILIALLAAVIIGSSLQWLLSSDVLAASVVYVVDDLLLGGLLVLIGKIFVASLKVLVVPLVFVSLVCGVCHLREQSSLGWLSAKTIGLYLFTTAVAISLALSIALIVDPGEGMSLTTDSQFSAPEATPLLDVLVNIFPTNPFQAFTEGNMLQVIVFALLIGLAISQSGAAGERLARRFTDWNEVLMTLVGLLMKLAPYGVFALVATLFAQRGFGAFADLAVYMLTVVGVLLLHGTIVYPALLKVLSGQSPRLFLKKLFPVQLFAFSTASSAATLPVTLKTVEQQLGVKNRVASFVVPMGATINMDGTAIMQGVATVFIAQAFAIDLTASDYLLVILTATLASIGTAGVPGVGLVTLALVLQQVGLPVEGIALIIGVDRILDMLRTAVNVTGDAAVATIVAASENDLDRQVFNQSVVPIETRQ